MTAAMGYLLGRRIINMLKSIVKSPAKLIYGIILIAVLGLALFTKSPEEGARELRNLSELGAIVSAVYILMFVMVAKGGFDKGSSLFKMADVNLLFTCPVSPRRVLFYGLFQQLGTSLLLGLFILFQYGWMKNVYGVTLPGLFVILAGYSLVVFTSQFTAMVIYSLTGSHPGRKMAVKTAFYAILAAAGLWLFLSVLRSGGDVLPALAAAVNSLPIRLFPVGGWAAGAVSGVIEGSLAGLLLGLGLLAAYLTAATLTLIFSKPDYYEDVLQTTESAFHIQRAAKEGRVAESAPGKLKPGKMGLGGGFGASVLFYKHKVENRRSRIFLLSGLQLIFVLVTVAFAFFMRGAGIVPAIAFGTYMQFFTIALGRFQKELAKPYIYLIPEPAFAKLLWSLRESVTGFVIEAVLVFVPVCLILGLGPAEMAASVAMRVSFSLVFLVATLVSEHIFGTVTIKTLIFFFYFLVVLILALPGVFLAGFMYFHGVTPVSFEFTICLTMAVCNLPIAMLCAFLCRNILNNAELNF